MIMAEYIDRDMFLKMISHKPSSPTTDREDRLINGFISAVKNCPAADVRPVVTCADCKYNNACLTQAFVEEASRVPFDRNTFFCADGEKREAS